MPALPMDCPSCSHRLLVKRLSCQECGTEVEGLYDLPVLASVSRSDQEFILRFVKASGSLKAMAKLSGASYPTVRNRLDEVIEQLNQVEREEREDG